MMDRHKNRAFTLVEVLVAVTMIALVTVIAIPYLANSLAHYQTVTTVRKLVADIQYTQQLAVTTEDTTAAYEMVFRRDQEKYYIKHGTRILRTERFPTWVDLAGTNVQAGGESNILAFSVQGSPVGAGTITIKNRRSGKSYSVKVAVITGRVRVE